MAASRISIEEKFAAKSAADSLDVSYWDSANKSNRQDDRISRAVLSAAESMGISDQKLTERLIKQVEQRLKQIEHRKHILNSLEETKLDASSENDACDSG